MNVHFLGGMPRAGSTLLLNLLGQNPRFYVSPTSGVLELVYATRNTFSNHAEFKAQNAEEMNARLANALRGLVTGWYLPPPPHDMKAIDAAFDKSRGWLQYYELLSSFWPHPKVIVPIRDIRDAIASFERLWRAHPFFHYPADDPATHPNFQFVDGRVHHWTTTASPIGLSLARIYDAFARGHAENLLFVRYEDLCNEPLRELKRIYDFTEQTWFDGHDPKYVEQITKEDDSLFGPLGDHQIRTRITPNSNQWQDMLPRHCAKLIIDTFGWFYKEFYPKLKLKP